MPTAEMHRLFIAIPVPETVKDAIQKAQTELRAALSANMIRWTKREQFHLTLRFLGNVEASRLENLAAAVQDACGRFTVLWLRAERIGFFPAMRHPRVVWAWVHDAKEQLPLLQSAVQSAVADYTMEAPEERFTGHVTVGRAKTMTKGQADVLAKQALQMVTRCFGEWTADRVEIIRSEPSPAGSRYTTVATAQLARGTTRSARAERNS